MKNLEPLGNHVLIEPVKVSDKVGSGILYKPDAWKQPSGEGIVIAVGPGRPDYMTGKMIKPEVEPGDHVLFTWINGREVNDEGRQLKVLDAAEILVKFKPERKNYAKNELLQNNLPGERVSTGAQDNQKHEDGV